MFPFEFGNPEAIAIARKGVIAARITECRDCDDHGKVEEDCGSCEGSGANGEQHCDTCSCQDCSECGGKGRVLVDCAHPDLPDNPPTS